MSLAVFATPRRLNESMCELVIGGGAGETWLVCLSLHLSLLPLFFLSRLVAGLASKRQGADRPFLWYKQESHMEVKFNVPGFAVVCR